jgi:hypothetical protein
MDRDFCCADFNPNDFMGLVSNPQQERSDYLFRQSSDFGDVPLADARAEALSSSTSSLDGSKNSCAKTRVSARR